jgi:hypothetical protein
MPKTMDETEIAKKNGDKGCVAQNPRDPSPESKLLTLDDLARLGIVLWPASRIGSNVFAFSNAYGVQTRCLESLHATDAANFKLGPGETILHHHPAEQSVADKN